MTSPRPRAIFFGTPEFAVPCLSVLAGLCEVVLVITQPDRPAGRGMKLTAPPVKVRAQELGLQVLQPTKVRTQEFAAELAALRADVALVVAYGRILPVAVLRAPRLGCVNVHASLLPKLRGAAPIQWAIVNGEKCTGVCFMQMDEGMDTGPVLARAQTEITANETAGELSERLSALGAEVVRRELPRFLRGELVPTPQAESEVSLAPVLRKEHGSVEWQLSATELNNLVRGMNPWPGAYTWLDGVRVKLHASRVLDSAPSMAVPGQILSADAHGIAVACGSGVLQITELQIEGSKRMSAAAFVAGAGQRLQSGARFTKVPP